MSSLPHLVFKTDSRISEIPVSTDQIIKIINKINPNKAHGFDDISVKMIKLCPELLASPLKLIFEKCIQEGSFPKSWKKANVQPVHKKVVASLKQTIGLFHFFLFSAKFSKKSFLMVCMDFCILTILSLIINLVFVPVTPL